VKNLFDIINLLKRFGVYVYTGNRKDDIFLMELEVKDLFDGGLLLREDFLTALLILRNELTGIEKKS
jgi:uncharacterized protein YqgQ